MTTIALNRHQEGKMSIIISDEILDTTRMSKNELLQEIAVMLFQKDKLTLGQASKMAGISRLQFQHQLASRQIPLHYDLDDFEDDLATLRALGRL
jgi:predicted HTH domain antitoxin